MIDIRLFVVLGLVAIGGSFALRALVPTTASTPLADRGRRHGKADGEPSRRTTAPTRTPRRTRPRRGTSAPSRPDRAREGTSRPLSPIGPDRAREGRRPPRPISPDLSPQERAGRLDEAVDGLRLRSPELSAFRTLSRGQRRTLLVAVAIVVLASIFNVKDVAIAFVGLCGFVYLAGIIFRLRLLRLSASGLNVISITDDEALSVADDELPSYTVLVPAFHEPTVVERLIDSIGRFDYPPELLDVKLLLEDDDTSTVEAAFASPGVEAFDIVLVPAAGPRTKPKALNYGLQFAEGELLTIYDAEDRPDPLQLRKAALALRQAGPDTACVQAELGYFNPTQNMITRWFTIEYLMWFGQMLPGLSRIDAPVPLGGTSNHFRREVLREVGGWDPYNVTEDADLGVRLHRLGYRTGILGSVTLEEANSDFINWARQRSRWYKGYLQSWLVHLRRPRELYRELGWRGFLRFNLFVGCTPLVALLNPLFWLLTIAWFIGHPIAIRAIFPAGVYYIGLFCWLVGNFLFAYLNVMVVLDADRDDLLWAALLSPLYWVMMSVAAVKAVYQLVFAPSYWEKTHHGLDAAESVGGGVRSP